MKLRILIVFNRLNDADIKNIATRMLKTLTKRLENITLKNIFLDYYTCEETVDRRRFIPEYAKTYPEGWRFRNLPSYALWSRHTKNLKLENFKCNHVLSTWKKDIIQIDNK